MMEHAPENSLDILRRILRIRFLIRTQLLDMETNADKILELKGYIKALEELYEDIFEEQLGL